MVIETFKTFKNESGLRQDRPVPFSIKDPNSVVMSVEKKANQYDEITIHEDITFKVEDGDFDFILAFERCLNTVDGFKDVITDPRFKFSVFEKLEKKPFRTHPAALLQDCKDCYSFMTCDLQKFTRASYLKDGKPFGDETEKTIYNRRSKFLMSFGLDGEDMGDYFVLQHVYTFIHNLRPGYKMYELIRRCKYDKSADGLKYAKSEYGLRITPMPDGKMGEPTCYLFEEIDMNAILSGLSSKK